jgi:hypothetical protein
VRAHETNAAAAAAATRRLLALVRCRSHRTCTVRTIRLSRCRAARVSAVSRAMAQNDMSDDAILQALQLSAGLGDTADGDAAKRAKAAKEAATKKVERDWSLQQVILDEKKKKKDPTVEEQRCIKFLEDCSLSGYKDIGDMIDKIGEEKFTVRCEDEKGEMVWHKLAKLKIKDEDGEQKFKRAFKQIENQTVSQPARSPCHTWLRQPHTQLRWLRTHARTSQPTHMPPPWDVCRPPLARPSMGVRVECPRACAARLVALSWVRLMRVLRACGSCRGPRST